MEGAQIASDFVHERAEIVPPVDFVARAGLEEPEKTGRRPEAIAGRTAKFDHGGAVPAYVIQQCGASGDQIGVEGRAFAHHTQPPPLGGRSRTRLCANSVIGVPRL